MFSSRSPSRDIAEIQELLRDLERRIESLTSEAKKTANATADAAPDITTAAAAAISAMAERLRGGARGVGDGAARMGTEALHAIESAGADALHTVERKVEERPVAMLAVAAGIGFLLGLAAKR